LKIILGYRRRFGSWLYFRQVLKEILHSQFYEVSYTEVINIPAQR